MVPPAVLLAAVVEGAVWAPAGEAAPAALLEPAPLAAPALGLAVPGSAAGPAGLPLSLAALTAEAAMAAAGCAVSPCSSPS